MILACILVTSDQHSGMFRLCDAMWINCVSSNWNESFYWRHFYSDSYNYVSLAVLQLLLQLSCSALPPHGSIQLWTSTLDSVPTLLYFSSQPQHRSGCWNFTLSGAFSLLIQAFFRVISDHLRPGFDFTCSMFVTAEMHCLGNASFGFIRCYTTKHPLSFHHGKHVCCFPCNGPLLRSHGSIPSRFQTCDIAPS
jgi:hypothetical protein